jgi:hypothetical protein
MKGSSRSSGSLTDFYCASGCTDATPTKMPWGCLDARLDSFVFIDDYIIYYLLYPMKNQWYDDVAGA